MWSMRKKRLKMQNKSGLTRSAAGSEQKCERNRGIRLRVAAAALLLTALLAVACGKAAGTEAAPVGAGSVSTAEESLQSAAEGAAGSAAESEAQAGEHADGHAGMSAGGTETAAPVEVGREGMVPIPGEEVPDGVYDLAVDSSSSMFRIEHCALLSQDGRMTAVLTMGGSGYLYLYPGSGAEAEDAPESSRIAAEEDAQGRTTFTVPVEALDQKLSFAAFSRRKQKWYDRTLVFRADSLPDEVLKKRAEAEGIRAESLSLTDGKYEVPVVLEGGSGRASVSSPAELSVEGGKYSAVIVFSSPNYDRMRVNGTEYTPVNTEGNSVFIIPVERFDCALTVYANTTAMSAPHEIRYTLYFDSSGIQAAGAEASVPAAFSAGRELPQPSFATQFTLTPWSEGCTLLTIHQTERYLVLEEGARLPENRERDMTVIRKPLKHIYLAASSAMDSFLRLSALSAVRMSGIREEDWSFPEVRERMARGKLLYAGSYGMPDYEMLLREHCDLALESTMLLHKPAVKEQLARLGIPVLMERSSYEPSPLGRMEWIRLYGFLTDREEEADALFRRGIDAVRPILKQEGTEKTVAFFYIGANGSFHVRRAGDYITQMIEMAGGQYVFPASAAGESTAASVRMSAESFYAAAREADILIYSGSIGEEPRSMQALLRKNALLSDFRAVKNGAVWCAGKSLFQQTGGIADIIAELHEIVAADSGKSKDNSGEGLLYFYRLQ